MFGCCVPYFTVLQHFVTFVILRQLNTLICTLRGNLISKLFECDGYEYVHGCQCPKIEKAYESFISISVLKYQHF